MAAERVKWIDEIRGLAIILVIIGHVIGGLDANLVPLRGGGIRELIYSFHMPLLFMISGLVTSEVKYSGIKWLLKKVSHLFASLYIPYLIWGYLFWATKYFIYAGNEEVTLEQGINLFWNHTGWSAGWFLLTLLLIKVFDLLMDCLVHNLQMKLFLWFGMFLAGWLLREFYLLPLILQYGIYYQIGKWMKNKNFEESRFINYNTCFMLLGVLLTIRIAGHFNYLMNFGIACCISIPLIFTYSRLKYHSAVMEMIGQSSMIPYVLHPYVTVFVRVILYRCNCKDFSVYVITATGAAILFSLVAIKLVDSFQCLGVLFYPAGMVEKLHYERFLHNKKC